MSPSQPHQPGEFVARDSARSRALRAAELLLIGQGARPAPPPRDEDLATVRSLDALLAQTTRASRHTSGSVRAYASLIMDGYGAESNAGTWAAKIERTASDLEEFASRLGALRVCEDERPSDLRWGDALARVAARVGSLGVCTIEVVDRTEGPFRQRAELLGRVLFHLLRNAVEASPRGGMVRVRADEIRIEGGRAVHLRITDAGQGMGRGDATNSLWKPFVSTKPGHAGLGLAYVSACASTLNIVNGVRSETGGTTIHTVVFEQGDLTW